MSLAGRPPNQGQIISSFTHFGPAVQQFVRGDPKRIRPNFINSPFEQYHYSNGYTGHLTPSGHFVAKNNYPASLHFSPNGAGSYQFTNTFIPSAGIKPSSEALHFVNPSSQLSQNPASPQPSPSHLPALPTVPPSVLSPFFQQIQNQQHEAASTPTPVAQTQSDNNVNVQNSNSFQLLNDEYTINLVPPPFKHTESTRFRQRQPSLSPTTPIPSTSPVPAPTGPSPSPDFFDEEQQKALEILNKYNIPAISPLQDSNRYAYNSGPLIVLSSTPSTPSSYSDAHIYQHIWQNSNQTSYTTEKPNLFRNVARPTENEYTQHKIIHPGYSGVKRPIDYSINPSSTPFLPTPDSGQNNAITHSFFTIEDAITLSPHLHYRRPVLPTNANEIEVSIKTPQNEDFVRISSTEPPREISVAEPNEKVTLQPPPAIPDTKLRNRNKLRRKRPKPTTENTLVISEQKPQRIKPNEEKDENKWDSQTEMPKNHKEYTITRERGPPNQSYRETTSENPREVTTNAYNSYRNSLRTRNRTRLPGVTETTSERPQRSKKPSINNEQRRPNNRFEDNKIQRQRPQIEKTTRTPNEDDELTTINLNYLNNYTKHSRRPTTTPQAISVSTNAQEDPIDIRPTEVEEFYREEKLPNRFRNGVSSSTISSIISPTIQNVIIDTTQGRLEESPAISSTRFTLSSTPTISSHEADFIAYDEEIKATDPNGIISTQNIPSSLSSVAVTPSDNTDLNKEVIITPDGPIFLGEGPVYKAEDTENKDDIATSSEPTRHRQRLRNKDKIMEAVAAATLSASSSTKIPKGRDENEVTDIEKEHHSLSSDKDGKLRVRLPVFKGATKQIDDQGSINSTKSTRLSNANKFDSKYRPRFSIKEHRQRLTTSSTTTDPSQSSERDSTTSAYPPRLRFPTRTRLLPELRNKSQESNKIDEKSNIADNLEKPIESSSEHNIETTRKRFMPKDRFSSRVKSTTEISDQNGSTAFTTLAPSSTNKPTHRRGSTRRDYLSNRTRYTTSTTPYPSIDHPITRVPIIRNSSVPLRRPPAVNLRQRIQEKKKKEQQGSTTLTIDDSINDLAVESSSEDKVSLTSIESSPTSTGTSSSTEEYKHETAIMKIAKDDHSYRPHMHKDKTTTEKTPMPKLGNDLSDSPSQQSERVAELTIFGSNQFNSVNTGGASRRIPGYFTLATEDPILPIEAFFPQVKKN